MISEYNFNSLRRLSNLLQPLFKQEADLSALLQKQLVAPGRWEGTQESSDIWPLSIFPSPTPWSDIQLYTYEELVYRRKQVWSEAIKVFKRVRL